MSWIVERIEFQSALLKLNLEFEFVEPDSRSTPENTLKVIELWSFVR